MKSEDFNVLNIQNYGDLIFETKYWVILLAPDQRNIGTCIIALKRHEADLGGLDHEEWLEFIKIVSSLQNSIKQSFNSVMFNFGSLLNASYLEDEPDLHVHWYVIPRYKEKFEFEGFTFEDPCFGYSTLKSKQSSLIIPQNVRIKIIRRIRENFKI